MTWPINHKSPLLLDGWLEFNRYKWNVTPIKLRISEEGKKVPAVEAILYLDKVGRIVQPPLNPYLPVVFYPTPTDKVTRLYRQWQTLSQMLVKEFIKRGQRAVIAFPPEVVDVRQWQWHGFIAEVRYTFYVNLPYELNDFAEPNKIRKAQREGFTCEIADPATFGEIERCLVETETRKGFSHRVTKHDLERALDFLGEEVLRIYVCRSRDGEIGSVHIVLSVARGMALFWIAGTKTKFLSSGARQLLIWNSLQDLARQEIALCDFVGANLPSVSAGKADWGGMLMPYYALRPLNLRTIGSLGLNILKYWMKANEIVTN